MNTKPKLLVTSHQLLVGNSSGFTLIELLIVISIIGILSSAILVGLGGARSAARDARRISDLKQVQNALELFYGQCGFYPGTIDASGCQPATVSYGTDSSSGLGVSLKQVGVSRIPYDPTIANNYAYAANANDGLQHYVLSAKLESSNSSLKDSVHQADADILLGASGVINCNEGQFYYCVSN